MGSDDLQILLDPPEFMHAPHSMTDVEYNYGGVVFPMLSGFLRGWTIRSSTSLASYLFLLFRWMPKLLYFFSLFFSLCVMTPNVRNFNREDLLPMSPLILHIFLGRFILMA